MRFTREEIFGIQELAQLCSLSYVGQQKVVLVIEQLRRDLCQALDALQRLHDECCTYSDHGRIVRLNLGPMIEPSEAAVLEARKVLEGDRNGDR